MESLLAHLREELLFIAACTTVFACIMLVGIGACYIIRSLT